MIVRLSKRAFWRHVSRRSRYGSQFVSVCSVNASVGAHFSSLSKIKDLDVIPHVESNIIWFQVTIDDANNRCEVLRKQIINSNRRTNS
jgi:hypothetical protein